MKRVLLISGIPAAGKSHFGAWLACKHGYLHFDVENQGSQLERLSLASSWHELLRGHSAGSFVDALRQLDRPVVWDWGFPPEYVETLRRLKQAGVELWWFNADHGAAQRAFIDRNTVPLAALDVQMAKILRSWPDIRRVFDPNIIETLDPNGNRRTPEEIWGLMS